MKRIRLRGRSLARRGLQALSAITVAALTIGAGVGGATGAMAAPVTANSEIVIIPLANASSPHNQFEPFQYNVAYSCSSSGGTGCAGAVIRVPITLEQRSGQVERFNTWAMTAEVSAASVAGFTQSWETSGNTRTLVLTARNSIPAGVQEAIALTIQPPSWVGNDVRFTVGGAQFTSANTAPVTSNSHTAQVTNTQLAQPTLAAQSGYRPSSTDQSQIVTYAFDPKFNNILPASGPAYLFGLGRTHLATGPNVTAQFESITLEVEIPVGGTLWALNGAATTNGTIPFPAVTQSGGSGSTSSYTLTQNGNTVRVTLPAHMLPTDQIRFIVEYPATMAGQQVCLTGHRSFTATNGDTHNDAVDLCHNLNYSQLQAAQATKCGHGGVSFAGGSMAGRCSATVMLPKGWTATGAGNPSTGRYVLSMRNSYAGDRVVFEDFMPCFDAPGASTEAESFTSQQTCANPAVKITQVTVGIQPVAGPFQSFTAGAYYQLINSDGTISTGAIPITDPFPAQPATGHWTGVRVLIEGVPTAGTASAIVHVEALDGVDREMILENQFAADLTRMSTGEVEHTPRSTVGVIHVKNIVSGSARANLGYGTGQSYATVSGSFTWGRLDPGVALPANTLQLPPGFDVRHGDLSTFTVQYNGVGQRYPIVDHFTVTVVPEDMSTGTGPRLVMVPIPGTPAVPVNGAGWPNSAIQGQIEPTWGEWNTRQTVTAAISINGGALAIDSCTGGTVQVDGDSIDRDGDGITDADVACEWAHTAMLGIPNAAATAVASKSVRDAGDTSWVSAGHEPARVTSESMEYLITWRNSGQPSLTDVVMYDMLPAIGDRGSLSTTSNTPRGSEYTPTFTGIVGAIPQGMHVAYSASQNPCRPEVLPNNTGCVNDWAANPADLGGNAQVTALRLTMPGTQVTGTNFSLVFGMDIPEDATAGDVAWNTTAHSSSLNGQVMAPAETAAVGAEVASNVIVGKVASDSEAGGAGFAVGEPVTYTLEATNEYGANVEPVTLTDDLSDVLRHATYNGDAQASTGTVTYDAETQTLSWQGDLGPRERVVITYTVTGTSLTTETLTNTVIGTANEGPTNCVTGNEEGCFAEVSFYGVPGVALDKVATDVIEGEPVLTGTLVHWEYRVTNTGSEDLTIVEVTDNRGVVVTCDTTTIPIGQTVVCSGEGAVSGSPNYTNIGTALVEGVASRDRIQAVDSWTTPVDPLTTGVEVVKTAEGVAEGTEVHPNQEITWWYTVTNTATDTITSVTVTDDRGVQVTCPTPARIAPGESIRCSGTGHVGYAVNYTNIATATVVGEATGTTATDTDDWSVTVRQQRVGLEIEKSADSVGENGTVVKDTVVTWRYVVTNPGEEPIRSIVVSDDRDVAVACPATELAPGESMICTGSGSVGSAESYTNIGTVTGTSEHTHREVSAHDSWTVAIRDLIPSLSIVKGATNALAGGSVLAGTTVNWNYTVTNTGEEAITDLRVVDDQGVDVSCPDTELALGETVTCTGSARIGNVGSYANIGTATGEGVVTGTAATASDEWSIDVEEPSTTALLVKESTEFASGSTLVTNTEVTWEYVVTNAGSETLLNIDVADDQGVDVTCPAESLAPGESMTCTGTGTVGDGTSYTNIGVVTAVGEVTGHETAGEDSWTVTLVPRVVTVDDPEDPVWPVVPAEGDVPRTGHPLASTGGLALGAMGAAGLSMLLLGLVLLARQRRHMKG